MQAMDGRVRVHACKCELVFARTHIAVSVPEKAMMYAGAKRCISQRSVSGPFLAASFRVSLPVHQSPCQRTVGGERGACKGRLSAYLSLAVPAGDGGSHLTKGNVVNFD